MPIIIDMLSSKKFSKVIVFCSKKLNVKQLTIKLKNANLAVAEIHSDLDQKAGNNICRILEIKNKYFGGYRCIKQGY